jgi:hypothetical protein
MTVALARPLVTEAIRWASPQQEEAFHWGPSPLCLSGGFGSGKTHGACLRAIHISDLFPFNRGVIARRVGKELRATTMSTFFKILPPSAYAQKFGGRRNDSEGYLRLARSQSEILFLHLENSEISSILKGLEINWFVWDQAEENPEGGEEIFDTMVSRLGRWTKTEVPQWLVDEHVRTTGTPWPYYYPGTTRPQPPSYATIVCNPDVETHWIYRRFHPESEESGEYREKRGYHFIHMPSDSNEFLSDINKQLLYTQDAAFVRRNALGLWGLPAGAIHHIDKRSLVPGSPELLAHLRQTCTLHRSMDHGDSAPTCCLWWAVDRAGNVICLREYYQPNALISTHRKNITELSEFESYDFNLADPSIFNTTMQSAKKGKFSVADEYRDVVEQPAHTALFWTAGDNNELGTRNRINEYLRVDETRVHPFTQAVGAPRLFFLTPTPDYPQGCVHVLRQTRGQRREKVGTELGRPIFSDERDPDVPDHAYDCLRYFIASRPPLAVALGPTAGPNTFFGAQQRLAQKQRRQWGMR